MKRGIVWFKTDLRLHDNETLVQAIEQSDEIIPVYCFDESLFKITEFGFNKSKLIFLEKRKEVVHAYCDHEKAKKELNFQDSTNLEDLIKNMYIHYLSFPEKKVEYMKYEIEKNMYSFWKK